MKFKNLLLLLPLLLLSGCADGHYLPEGKNANVILLMGQSNATGIAKFEDLATNAPDVYSEFCNGYDNVALAQHCENASKIGDNKFHKLANNESYELKQFGPEIGIGRWMNSHSTKPTYIIKSSWNGSNLDNQWLNHAGARGDLYNGTLDYASGKLKVLKNNHITVDSFSICWMQGESDNFYDCGAYASNTENFIKYLREDFKSYSNNIAFIDAYISATTLNGNGQPAWPNATIINQAKQTVADKDALVSVIKTNGEDASALNLVTKPDDPAHYNAVSQIALGEEFAKRILSLIGE